MIRVCLCGRCGTQQFNISVDEERALALKRLQAICSQGFFSVRDFRTNPDKIFAAHELAGFADGSMATKMTVQFNVSGTRFGAATCSSVSP